MEVFQMPKFQLLAASPADLPKEYLDSRNIACLPYVFNINGVEYKDDFGQTIPYEDFYRQIDEGAMPTTSQPNIEDHCRFFEPYLKEGKDILYVSFSSGLTGAYNTACLAKETLSEQYPERRIEIIDSIGASSGLGLLIDAIADCRDSEATLDEAVAFAEEKKKKTHHWFFSTTLKHYYRGGRISAGSAIIGTMLGICPLLNMDNRGRLIPRQKIKGKNAVIRKIVDEMEAHAEGGTSYSGKCFISHANCLEDAEKVAALVEQRFPKLNGKVMINWIGTVIGSHTGPGTVALFFFGDERTE